MTKAAKSPDANALEAFMRNPEALDILRAQGFTILAK